MRMVAVWVEVSHSSFYFQFYSRCSIINEHMSKNTTIVKSNGEKEFFDSAKLVYSLARAGADKNVVESIVRHIEGELSEDMTTAEIYRHAFELLRRTEKRVAVKYSLKRALLDLGPDGFPFEKFVAEIFKARGFETLTDQVVQGGCVEHEMDVVAWNDTELHMVEAKFHNEPGLKSDLKIALYIKARFDDLQTVDFSYGGKTRKLTRGWLFTNTKFTDHAIRYGECKKLSMVGWNYPHEKSLEDMVIEANLHPLTCLGSLSQSDKKILLKNGLSLCRHVAERKDELKAFGIDENRIPVVLDEIASICS